ncbi:hypothetical protein COV15_02975 [Candidatus Woesearchaeota archaeon CG10_big_fil_rev_8_21_14_0_10_34_12]|nr:MAG: hypothetical protein COV15_02975 [Candidatus Woesearchaeota archaeon CG10_big_fil_rev_8_21_14_0_10_34_12]
MKAIKHFESFLEEGIVKKQFPDKSRAEFLIKEAEKGWQALLELNKKIGINENNANIYVKNCYDVIMEVIRAEMLLKGYNASGNEAHMAEVAYLRNLEFSEIDVQFLDQIRFFRNGMRYYGTIIDKEYAQKVFVFLEKNYHKIKNLIK